MPVEVSYSTDFGTMLLSTAEDALKDKVLTNNKGKVDLIFTSPPFPLTKKKDYGNLEGQKYVDWLSDFAIQFKKLLKPKGSLVVEIGNTWEPGAPVMQTWPLRALLGMLDASKMHLCQMFVCHNPSRMPSPAQWTNIERVRVKDSYTHLWWMSPHKNPKADNRRILTAYSKSMQRLLKTGNYNNGDRPSGFTVNEDSFLTDNGGAISPSAMNLEESDPFALNFLEISNTGTDAAYFEYCRRNSLKPHPARMQPMLAEFFIRFLTNTGDLVFDPFAGSNTTGAVAERLGRNWISSEPNRCYVEGSKGRFENEAILAA